MLEARRRLQLINTIVKAIGLQLRFIILTYFSTSALDMWFDPNRRHQIRFCQMSKPIALEINDHSTRITRK